MFFSLNYQKEITGMTIGSDGMIFLSRHGKCYYDTRPGYIYIYIYTGANQKLADLMKPLDQLSLWINAKCS